MGDRSDVLAARDAEAKAADKMYKNVERRIREVSARFNDPCVAPSPEDCRDAIVTLASLFAEFVAMHRGAP